MSIDIATRLAKGEDVSLPNGDTLHLTVEVDHDTSVSDFPDSYGLVEYVASPWDSNGMRAERPKGFDGAAEKLNIQGDVYWWQPTLETWGIDRSEWHSNHELRRSNRQAVKDVLAFGFTFLMLERKGKCDCCGASKVKDYACLGGVEPLADESSIAEILRESLLPDLEV